MFVRLVDRIDFWTSACVVSAGSAFGPAARAGAAWRRRRRGAAVRVRAAPRQSALILRGSPGLVSQLVHEAGRELALIQVVRIRDLVAVERIAPGAAPVVVQIGRVVLGLQLEPDLLPLDLEAAAESEREPGDRVESAIRVE